ncbi:MAG: cysteine desulfurase [Alphaproteobacteria bacterium]|nr:cysteine desulfurase [Alphaproteobacteria bacterium]
MPRITYLDYNATNPVRPEVVARMSKLLTEPHNASSVHFYGREGKKYIENAREIIAQSLNCWKNEIVFTSCGTEANNAVLRGEASRRILISAIEHSSITKTVPHAQRIPVDNQGIVQLDALREMLEQDTTPTLVSVMLANNETGAIQPIADIVKICRAWGGDVLVHTDAAQALGKISTDFSMLGVDMMTVSAHKLGGAHGAAALILRNDLPIKPLLTGGGQELGRRAGTENVAAINGFGLAVELAQKDAAHWQNLRGWLDAMENEIIAHAQNAYVFSKDVARLPGTSCVAMPGISSETQLMAFDLNGVAVSAGSACSSGKIEASHVIKAMGFGKDIAATAIRISGGWNTTQEDIAKATNEWKKLYDRIGKKTSKKVESCAHE